MFWLAGVIVVLFVVGCLVAVYWGATSERRGGGWLPWVWMIYMGTLALNFLSEQIWAQRAETQFLSWVILALIGTGLLTYSWYRGAKNVTAPLEVDWDAIGRDGFPR